MKRKLFLMVMAIFLIPWIGNAQITTFPYSEDFEGTFLPGGWVKVLGDAAANNITQSNTFNHTTGGKYSVRFSSYNTASDYNQYLFTDTIHVTSGYTKLTFWSKKLTSSAETLKWGISTTTQSKAAVSSWTTVTFSTNWQKTTVYLTAHVGSTIFFAWHYYGHYLYYVYLDDVKIEATPSCPPPSPQTVSNITSSQAGLGWTENGTAASWDIEYGTSGFTFDANKPTTTVTTNPYTYTGLSANTKYDWYVRSKCSGGSYSSWLGPATFTTTAPLQSLPFSENWESNALSDTKWNWYSGSKATILTAYYARHKGSYGLVQYGNGGATPPSSLADAYNKAKPGGANEEWTTWNKVRVDLTSASNPLLTFWYSMGYYGNDNYNNFWVQVSTDGTTWTDLFSIQPTGSTITYKEKQLDLSAYKGKKLFIRFFHSGFTNNNYLYLDDISVADVSCPPPSSQIVSNITSSQAGLGWTQTGSSAASWDIELGTSGFSPTGTPTQTGVTNPFTYTGLSSITKYDWYVRANCGAGGKNSNWVGPASFTTAQAPLSAHSLPFSEDWESNALSDTKWNWYSGSSSTIQISSNAKHKGSYGLVQYGSAAAGYSYTTPSSLADAYTKAKPGGANEKWTTWNKMRMDLTTASNPLLTFWYSMGYSTNDNDNNFWVQVSTNGTTWTDMFSTQTNGATIAYKEKQLDLSAYKGKKLFIRFFHNGKYSNNYLYLDDISVADVSCPDPYTQTVSNITYSSAGLGWTEISSAKAASWDIELGTSGFSPTGTPTQTGVTNPFTYTGLSSITKYDWYVRANCGAGGYSNWVGGSASFTTTQAPLSAHSLPFSEDWESNLLSDTKWNWYSGSSSTIQISPNAKHKGSYGLMQHGNAGGYTTPSSLADAYNKAKPGGANEKWTTWNKMRVDLTSASNPLLTFWYSMVYSTNDNDNNFWVQVSTDGTTWADLFSTQTNGATIAYNEKQFDLSAYKGKKLFIRFFHNGWSYYNSLYLDDISVADVSCPDPYTQTVSNITYSSAGLGWTEISSAKAASWNIELGTSGFSPTGTPTQTGVTNPFTYTGLSSITKYDWYVRANCGTGGYSNWVGGSASFTTTQAPLSAHSFPFSEDWESNLLSDTKWNWHHGSSSTVRISTAAEHSSKYGLYLDATAGGYTTPSSLADAYTKAQLGKVNANWTSWNKMRVDLSTASNPWLTFWYSMGNNYTDNDNNFWVQVSTDGTTWTDLFSTQAIGSAIAYEKKQLDLSTYKGETLYIRFFHSGGTGGNGAYLYLDDISVADVNCPDPSTQTISHITSSSARLGWTEKGTATAWDIALGTPGFTPAAPTKAGVTNNPYTYTVSSHTQYDWYVRSSCGGGPHSSWVGPGTFTTPQAVASVQSFPFTEDWESSLSDTKWNWYYGSSSTIKTSTASKHNGTYGLEQYGSGGVFNGYTTPSSLADAYTKAQPGGANAKWTSWNKMSVDLSPSSVTSPWLTFWYSMGYNANDNENNFWVQDSANGTWTDLFSIQTNGANLAYEKKQIDLSSFKGTAKLYIRFFHNGASSTNYLYLDDISIANVSCPDPSAQTVSNITTSQAGLGWTENGTATSWDIALGTPGFTPAVPTKAGVTNKPYTYTGLSVNTQYDWYVRADCGGGSYSSWVGPGTITTKSNPVNPPYFQDFDAVTAPAFPGGMAVENTNGDYAKWHTATGYHHSSPNAAEIDASTSKATNDWFFTKGLNLTGGVKYEVDFVYLSGYSPEKLAVDWGANAGSTAMSGTPVFDNNNIKTEYTWVAGSGTFTPTTTGVYYVGFHGYSAANQYGLDVDDIQVVKHQQAATWAGTTDNDWTKGSNWSSGSPPGASTDVIIPPGKSHYPTLTKTAYTKNLTIQSNATGDGSLVGANHVVMVNGTGTVQLYLTGGKWHEVSAMTSGATVNSLYFNHNPDVWMKEYNEAGNNWTPVTSLTTAMPLGKGFDVWVKTGSNVTASFTGTINGKNVVPTSSFLSFKDLNHGFDLMGNPFPSAIDWNGLYTGGNHTEIDDQVWVWSNSASSYKDYVHGTGAGGLSGGIVPMGQGFFVHANASSPYLTIPASAQTANSQKFYKSSGRVVLPHFVLFAEKGDKKDQVWIVFHKGSTTAYENGFDGRKMIATRKGAAPQIYTKEDSEFFSIDCLPPVDEEGRTISLYFKANENGEQTIVAKDFDLVPGLNVVLEDTKLNVMQNLNNNPVYTFSADTAQNPARFLLHLNRSVNGIGKNTKTNIYAWAHNHYLYISATADVSNVKKQLLVIDMMGRKIIEETLPTGELIKKPLHLSNSWVIVRIISRGKVYTNKVFIR